jgi:hypothetical protein
MAGMETQLKLLCSHNHSRWLMAMYHTINYLS